MSQNHLSGQSPMNLTSFVLHDEVIGCSNFLEADKEGIALAFRGIRATVRVKLGRQIKERLSSLRAPCRRLKSELAVRIPYFSTGGHLAVCHWNM